MVDWMPPPKYSLIEFENHSKCKNTESGIHPALFISNRYLRNLFRKTYWWRCICCGLVLPAKTQDGTTPSSDYESEGIW